MQLARDNWAEQYSTIFIGVGTLGTYKSQATKALGFRTRSRRGSALDADCMCGRYLTGPLNVGRNHLERCVGQAQADKVEGRPDLQEQRPQICQKGGKKGSPPMEGGQGMLGQAPRCDGSKGSGDRRGMG